MTIFVGILVARGRAARRCSARRSPAIARERLGIVAEAPRHLLRRLQMPVGTALAAEAEFVDRAFLADRGDDVLQHAPVGRGRRARRRSRAASGRSARAAASSWCSRIASPGRRCCVRQTWPRSPNISAIQRSASGSPRIGDAGHQRADQPFGMRRDILPMEEAFALLALLRVGARLAEGEQAGEPAPGRRDPRARPAASCRRPDRAGSRRSSGSVRRLRQLLGRDQRAHHAAPPNCDRRCRARAGRAAPPCANSSSGEEAPRRKREMRRDLEFGIAHPNTPWRYQLRSPVAARSPSPRRNSQ